MEENTGEKLQDIGSGNDFLVWHQKHRQQEKKKKHWTTTKLKTCVPEKTQQVSEKATHRMGGNIYQAGIC